MAEHASAALEAVPEEEPAPALAPFTYLQYGLRMPNGAQVWAPVTITVRGTTVEVDPVQTPSPGAPFHGVDLAALERERHQTVPGPATETFRDVLYGLAASVYLDGDAYAAQVTVIHREVSLSVDTILRAVPVADHLEGLD